MKTFIVCLIITGLLLYFSPMGGAIRGDKSLLIYYSFDKDGGKEVLDDSGNKIAGAVTGAKWTKDGKIGGAMSFDGASNFVALPQKIDGFTDTKLKEITVEHWVILNVNKGDVQQIWEALNAAGAWPAETFIEGAQDMLFYIYDDNKVDHQAKTPPLELKKWQHIAGTYDGSVQRIYLNGKVVGSVDWKGTFTMVSNPKGVIVLGKDNEADIQHWNGLIDEFAVYTRALTEKELNEDMNKGIAFAVDPAAKLSTTWGRIKAER